MKRSDTFSVFRKLRQLLRMPPVNRDELVGLLQSAQEKTIITQETLVIIEGAILFSEMRARDIMLPKNQIVWINRNDSYKDIVERVIGSGHSRFPVTDVNTNTIIGILHAKDLLCLRDRNPEEFNLLDICRQVHFIPESKRLDSLLQEFRHTRNHMAIVVDEYGSVVGFITIEDIIEQIIGDIEDEFDIEEEPCIKRLSDLHYIVKSQTSISSFNEQLNANLCQETCETIGGLVLNRMGYLPKRGEIISIEGLEFTILKADTKHIKLLECIDKRPFYDGVPDGVST